MDIILSELVYTLSSQGVFYKSLRVDDEFVIQDPADCAEILSHSDDKAFLTGPFYNALFSLEDWIVNAKDALLKDDSLSHLLPMGSRLLKKPYCVLGRDLSLLFASPDFGFSVSDHELIPNVFSALSSDEEYRKAEKNIGAFTYRFHFLQDAALCILLTDGDYLLRLIVPDEDGQLIKNTGFMHLLRRFGEYLLRAAASSYREPLRSQDDPQHRLLSGLLFEPRKYTQSNAEIILNPFGWQADHDCILIKFRYPAEASPSSAIRRVCAELEQLEYYSCAVPDQDGIVWLINRTRAGCSLDRKKLTDIVGNAIDMLSYPAGISFSFKGFGMMQNYYNQANIALDVGERIAPEKQLYFYRDYSMDIVMNYLHSNFHPAFILHPSVVIMLRYDCKNDTDFFNTLRAYAETAGNIARAADKLNIHRTSLMRRLDRIGEICMDEIGEDDMHSPETLFRLQFSFRLLDYCYNGLEKAGLLNELDRPL